LAVVERIDLSDKACVITGASSGLGRESARALAAAGAHVVLAARDRGALARTADQIRAEVPGARASTVELDLTSLASVRAAATAIGDVAPAIHVLMNNAGVMFTPFGRTLDGFEMQIGTNHFGHFELTRLLVPRLAAAGGARIVTLSSGGHVLGDVDFDDPNWESREYDKFAAYGASKTANILHAIEADRRLRGLGIRAYAVHPGTVATSLARHMSRADFSRLRQHAGGPLAVATPECGAATQVWAAVSPELAGRGGLYLADCAKSDAVAPYARDERRAADWWTLSERLTAEAAPSSRPTASNGTAGAFDPGTR
jgi:NAD(P)-dependent dehydrogenase (short-subunit alcohol dehydrogenase family)